MEQNSQTSKEEILDVTTEGTPGKAAKKGRSKRRKHKAKPPPTEEVGTTTPNPKEKKSRAGSTPETMKGNSQMSTNSINNETPKKSDQKYYDALAFPASAQSQNQTETDEENNSDDETVYTTHRKPSATANKWKTVAPRRLLQQKTTKADELEPPVLHGYHTQIRSSFQLAITASTTLQEAEEKATIAIQTLVKTLLGKNAHILPWKEADYKESKVVTPENFTIFEKLSYAEMRKLYVDSGYVSTSSNRVFIYLYLGLPKAYNRFRVNVESDLTKAEIVWFKNAVQGERRIFLGYVTGSHNAADCEKIQETIHEATGLHVLARWRLWPIPYMARNNSDPESDEKVFAIGLETDARYNSSQRLLVYRTFGSDPNERTVKAIDSLITTHLVPGHFKSLSANGQQNYLLHRKFQGQINHSLRSKEVTDTFMYNINNPARKNDRKSKKDGKDPITMKDLILETINSKTNLPLILAIDQPKHKNNPIITYREEDRQEVEHFLEGVRITVEANFIKRFKQEEKFVHFFTDTANTNYDGQLYDHAEGRYIAKEETCFLLSGKTFIFEVEDWTRIVEENNIQAKMESLNLDDWSLTNYSASVASQGTIHSNETRFQDEYIGDYDLSTQLDITQPLTAAGDHESEAPAGEN